MRTQVKSVVMASRTPMEYAVSKAKSAGAEHLKPELEKEKIKDMVQSLVKQAVQKQLKEQQEYYRSRPSQAARQMEQIFGASSLEKALAPAISMRVYGQIEESIRRERIRKGR